MLDFYLEEPHLEAQPSSPAPLGVSHSETHAGRPEALCGFRSVYLNVLFSNSRLTPDLSGLIVQVGVCVMRFGLLLMVLGLGRTSIAGPLELEGVAHVAFRVGDLSTSRDFYKKLGFAQAFEFNDAAGTTTSYLKVNDRQFIELYRRRAGEPVGLMHLCFDVADIQHLHDAYVALGLQPSAPVKARAGNLLFNLRDPEGQVLEYTQYLPGSLHWNARGTPSQDPRISDHMLNLTVAVKDVPAEQAFYTEKLGFADRGEHRLRVPGTSDEEVVIEVIAPDWKPRIAFSVPDVPHAADELRRRGLNLHIGAGQAVVVDPDGTQLIFTSQ